MQIFDIIRAISKIYMFMQIFSLLLLRETRLCELENIC